MERRECISIDNLDALRAAIAAGDVSLYEIEHALQKRMDEELKKSASEVDSDLVERIESMLRISNAARLNGHARIRPWSFNDLMKAIKKEDNE